MTEEQIVIKSHRQDQWHVVSICPGDPENFLYLRSDETWGSDMRMDDDTNGYFQSEDQATVALSRHYEQGGHAAMGHLALVSGKLQVLTDFLEWLESKGIEFDFNHSKGFPFLNRSPAYAVDLYLEIDRQAVKTERGELELQRQAKEFVEVGCTVSCHVPGCDNPAVCICNKGWMHCDGHCGHAGDGEEACVVIGTDQSRKRPCIVVNCSNDALGDSRFCSSHPVQTGS